MKKNKDGPELQNIPLREGAAKELREAFNKESAKVDILSELEPGESIKVTRVGEDAAQVFEVEFRVQRGPGIYSETVVLTVMGFKGEKRRFLDMLRDAFHRVRDDVYAAEKKAKT